MSFASRSLPPESEDPPPSRRDLLLMEREALIPLIRPRMRTERQLRIRRRIALLTKQLMQEETRHG
ncbi:hypothetical protein CXZ10_05980 [Pleomorphomonas diazotrophica]|uniref:Uncharacterized protein n=1 Tax=Pleomorphomonas diazotrophica TaxID=1166257 RepID=A0A1I4Q815_9HYPH|nr:hypothetical protein CXZ10_05980 [Pleomorphomonas diazotrophica]SFM35780.1 hypothetical protein SAMN05192571_101115 [Pleomorphomonas diazotrophica]